MSRQIYYFDKVKQKMVEGYPPCPNVRYGEAPFVITDTIDPYRHPATGTWVESKKALRDIDRACGTITTDKRIAPESSWARENEKRRKQDLHKSMHAAVAKIDAGTVEMSEETREKCRLQNEIASAALGFDAFNVAGRKNDKRGKKYRRRGKNC